MDIVIYLFMDANNVSESCGIVEMLSFMEVCGTFWASPPIYDIEIYVCSC